MYINYKKIVSRRTKHTVHKNGIPTLSGSLEDADSVLSFNLSEFECSTKKNEVFRRDDIKISVGDRIEFIRHYYY